jgi:serine/threonine protein kinase
LLAQICSALVKAHDSGFLHRDIKPANVFLCNEGEICDTIKVLDFGLIKEFGQHAREARDTETEMGAVVGTPTYMPPEAVTAPETMDGRSDLYAVGALGYFLLTGAPPFSGKTVLEVCAQHLHCEPAPLSTHARACVPAKLEELILSCLAKAPEARPRDAAILRAALLPFAAAWTREGAMPDSDVRASGGSDVEQAVMCEAA